MTNRGALWVTTLEPIYSFPNVDSEPRDLYPAERLCRNRDAAACLTNVSLSFSSDGKVHMLVFLLFLLSEPAAAQTFPLESGSFVCTEANKGPKLFGRRRFNPFRLR